MLPHPAIHASHAGIWIATGEGCSRIGRGEAIRIAADTPVILLNSALIGQRLGHPDLSGLDLLELFAFIYPARFAVPTPAGLARAVDLSPPDRDEDVADVPARSRRRAACRPSGDWPEREGAWMTAGSLSRLRWPWAPLVMAAVARPSEADRPLFSRLPEWEEQPPRPAPRVVTLEPGEAEARLALLTGALDHGPTEERPGQRAYAAAAAAAFAPRSVRDAPNMVLAEAARGSARRSAISRPPRYGRRAAAGRCGFRPIPRRCNAS